MKKSYWYLFVLAILCPFFVGISFLLKYKQIPQYETVLYLAAGFLIGFIVLALKELFLLLKETKVD